MTEARYLAGPAASAVAAGIALGAPGGVAAAEADEWLLGVFESCWAAVESGTLDPLEGFAPEMKVEYGAEEYWYATSEGSLGSVKFEVVVRDGTVNECYVRRGGEDMAPVPFQDAEPTIAAWRAALSEMEGFHEIAPGRRIVEASRCPEDGPAVMAMAISDQHPDDAQARVAGSTLPYPGTLEFSVGRIPESGIEVFCGPGAQQ